MVEAVTAQEMQRFDHSTMEGNSSALVLRERRNGYHWSFAAGTIDLANVLVIAGLCNNGGDGVAINACWFKKALTSTRQILVMKIVRLANTATQLKIARGYGIHTQTVSVDFRNYTVIVDALIGIGL